MSGLSFSLDESERMLIVGESGAGKSSLLRAMAGLWTTGTVLTFPPCIGHVPMVAALFRGFCRCCSCGASLVEVPNLF